MSELRYEISILIGPCRQSEAETLCIELSDLLQGKQGELGSDLGAALAVGLAPEDYEANATHCGDCSSKLLGEPGSRYCPNCDEPADRKANP